MNCRGDSCFQLSSVIISMAFTQTLILDGYHVWKHWGGDVWGAHWYASLDASILRKNKTSSKTKIFLAMSFIWFWVKLLSIQLQCAISPALLSVRDRKFEAPLLNIDLLIIIKTFKMLCMYHSLYFSTKGDKTLKVKASVEFHSWFVGALVVPLSNRCRTPEDKHCGQFPGKIC